uniref:Uncharacterized protein n=2 Tax=Canis lupus familiaris TaxID=9615 RepID=A0A8C0YXU7_CANLF
MYLGITFMEILWLFVEPLICTDCIRQKFTKSRIPDKVFQPSPADHEKYGGDPQHPHKLHIVTRIKSTKRHPYWEKDIININYNHVLLSSSLMDPFIVLMFYMYYL